ncbi:MAG: metallophosphoesterase family protein [Deltaproteobacteria bacterium]|nr:metallophosphoesterase family protein [Deltaproteobacteria bacterium]
MKLGVISDTHLKQATPELRELMAGPFKDVEMILHAGDLTDLEVLEAFAGKEVQAVCGNMDSPSVRRQLPTHRTMQVGKFKIGLIHGWGRPQGLEERVRREFDRVDCIIYGHTHAPSQAEREGVLFFNPGAFGGGFISRKKSVGLLELGEKIFSQIIYF